ncbi:MAG: SMP-30/gluconolactonase/LRE family protein [Rubrobacteraceae bacterium]
MKTKLLTIPLFFLAFVLALLLAACGTANEGGSSSVEANSGTVVATDEAQGTTKETSSGETASVPKQFELPGQNIFPEGIAYDEATGDFFVSATSDGTIYRGNVEEGAETEVFLEGGQDDRTSAVGMTVDDEGRLFIAGRDTGRVFAYDTEDGQFIQSFENDRQNSLINDAVSTPDGDVYFTDSFAPVLYRVSDEGGELAFEEYIDFEGTPVEYRDGFNLNGIVATGDGRFLITVQYNTGDLFRIDIESREITQIELSGTSLSTGDGLVLDEQTLYVVRNEPGDVVPVELSEDFTSGEAGEGFGGDSFQYPTTAAKYGDRLLVVNSRFGGDPNQPFIVSSVPIPE